MLPSKKDLTVAYITDNKNNYNFRAAISNLIGRYRLIFILDKEFLQNFQDSSIEFSKNILREPLLKRVYQRLEFADYILIDKRTNLKWKMLDNVELIGRDSSKFFKIYRNVDVKRIALKDNMDAVFNGKKIIVPLNGDANNLFRIYLESGFSVGSKTLSWTNSKDLSLNIPVKDYSGDIKVEIEITDTYKGEQRYFIYSDQQFIGYGSIEGGGRVSFTVPAVSPVTHVSILLPDARPVVAPFVRNDVDYRALAIEKIEFNAINTRELSQ